MLVDFGLMKSTIKDFIDSFDHATLIWENDSDMLSSACSVSSRYILTPVSTSAEQQALLFLYVVDKIVKATEFNNGEKKPKVKAVIVHETDTGYAKAKRKDLKWVNYTLDDIHISNDIKQEWKDPKMFDKLIEATKNGIKCFVNPTVPRQV